MAVGKLGMIVRTWIGGGGGGVGEGGGWRRGGETHQQCLMVEFLTSHHHADVSQGRIYCTCCPRPSLPLTPDTEVTDQNFYLTQSQYTDTGPASPSTDCYAGRLSGYRKPLEY